MGRPEIRVMQWNVLPVTVRGLCMNRAQARDKTRLTSGRAPKFLVIDRGPADDKEYRERQLWIFTQGFPAGAFLPVNQSQT